MSITLESFTVRPPRDGEAALLAGWFANSLLGSREVTYIGAFGQPGDVPLGAVALRPLDASHNAAGFQVFVRPDCRRRSIGRSLVQHLYAFAQQNQIRRLTLAALVHQDAPDNAFFRAMGMSVTRQLRTYVVACERARQLCEPLLRRARARGHPHLAETRIVPMSQVNLTAVAQFFAQHFGGFADQRLADLSGGKVDLQLSQACLAAVPPPDDDDRVVGGVLVRPRPFVEGVMLDQILTAPSHRNGPLPLALIAAVESALSARGIGECHFEFDEQRDRFAAGFARESGARPKSCRYGYAVAMPPPKIASANRVGGVQRFAAQRLTFHVPDRHTPPGGPDRPKVIDQSTGRATTEPTPARERDPAERR